MANMEAIEQRTLAYLKQVSNPIVPLATLQAHLAQGEDCSISDADLLDFLHKHELFRVLEPMAAAGGPEASMLPVRPGVILETRTPTQTQLVAHMLSELTILQEALDKALREAQRTADHERVQAVAGLLERVEGLRERLMASMRARQ